MGVSITAENVELGWDEAGENALERNVPFDTLFPPLIDAVLTGGLLAGDRES